MPLESTDTKTEFQELQGKETKQKKKNTLIQCVCKLDIVLHEIPVMDFL